MAFNPAAIITGVLSLICIIFSITQFLGKGPILNNAYIYATPEQRAHMDTKPLRRQTGIVFLMLGVIFLLDTALLIFQSPWILILIGATMIGTAGYSINASKGGNRK